MSLLLETPIGIKSIKVGIFLTCPPGVTGAISRVCRLQPVFHHWKKFVDFAAQPLRKLWCELKNAGEKLT